MNKNKFERHNWSSTETKLLSYRNIDIKQLEELREKGLTINEICNLYKISRRTYYNKINKIKGGQA